MDNKRECFFATLDSVSLKSSKFENLSPVEGEININFSGELDLTLNDKKKILNKNETFEVSLKGIIKGILDSDKEKVIFEGDCTFIGKFKVISDKGLATKKIKESFGFYGLQIYPLVREHVTENLVKMNVNSNDMPWDIGIGDARIEN